jgi:fucose permease
MFQITVSGLLFVLPVFLQSALQLNALDTGFVLLPYTLGIFIFALGASRLPASIPVARVIQTGLLLMLIGSFWVHSNASLELDWARIIPPLFCFGAGGGMVLSRLTVITLSTVSPEKLSESTGGDSTGKELGVAFGIAILGSIFLTQVYGGIVDSYDKFHNLPEATGQDRDRAIVELEDWASKLSDKEWERYVNSLPDFARDSYLAIVKNSFLAGYKTILKAIFGIIVVMFALSLSLPRRNVAPSSDT